MTKNLQLDNLIKKLQTYVTDPKVFIDTEKIIEDFCVEVKNNDDIAGVLLQKLAKNNLQSGEIDIILYLLSFLISSESSAISLFSDLNISDVLRHRLFLVLQHRKLLHFSALNRLYTQKIKLANYAVYHILEYIDDTAENIDEVTKKIENDGNFYSELIELLSLTQKTKSIWLLGYFSQCADKSVALTAINALKKQESPIAQKILANLIFHQDALEQTQNTQVTTVDKCFLSWLDSYNNRIVIITYPSGEKTSIAFFMVNQEQGLQSVWTLKDLSSAQLESILAKWRKSIDIKEVDKQACLDVINNALWCHELHSSNLPASFLLREIFQYPELAPKQYNVNLEEMNLQVIKTKTQVLAKSSSYLVKEFPFNQWWLDTEESRDYILQKVGNEKNIKFEIMKEFAETFFSADATKLANKFLLMADFMRILSIEKHEKQIETSIAIYLSLTQEKIPLIDIAFVKQLVLLNIRNIQEKIYGS